MIKKILFLLVICLILVALNRPQIRAVVNRKIYQGPDVVFVVDVSLSMRAEDAIDGKESRLQLVKRNLIDLSHQLTDERISLVIFAGRSFPLIPFLTRDQSVFRFFIGELSTSLIPKRGTDIGDAILRAIEILKESKRENKLIILVSDGELQGENRETLNQALLEIRKRRVILHTVGVGSKAGAYIPIMGEDQQRKFLTDKEGKLVVSRLNENLLMEMTRVGNGRYIHLGSGSIYPLVKSGRTLARVEREKTWISIHKWFLIPALVLFSMWLIL